MAVVENAADGLSLTVPALGLPIPLQFSHLPPDPDLDSSQPPPDRFLLRHIHSHGTHLVLPHDHPLKQQHFDLDQNPTLTPTDSSSATPPVSHDRIKAAAETAPDSADSAAPNEESSGKAASVENGETMSADDQTLIFHDGEPGSGSTTNADTQKRFGKDDIQELEDLLSKLNPLAKEFIPSSLLTSDLSANGTGRKKRNNGSMGRRRTNGRTSKAQLEECVRRTVYVSDIDQQVTEEQLAALFLTCGHVVDCRVCGDPNSVLRFAFVEFTDEEGAKAALGLSGTMLGFYPVRVLPSKTAIVPVNPSFLPRSENEREMCARTVYCTNIDKKVSQADVKLFFETLCGEVARLRLLGDYRHSTRIAFVEFVKAESAMSALNCSGAILGSLPLRVSPSKTPVRPRSPRLVSQ